MEHKDGLTMNRFVIFWGAILASSGAVMYVVIHGLGFQIFRPQISPYQNTALATALVGVAIVILGLAIGPSKRRNIETAKASKYFLYAAFLNAIAAVFFISPILDPSLKFPILITQWPGIYMVIGYSMFLVIGVIGMFCWSVLYNLAPKLLSRQMVDARMFLLHLVLMEVGIYALSVSMFIGGYAGASILYEGGGAAIAGAQMEIGVVPSGVAIFTLMMSTIIGVSTFIFKRNIDAITVDTNPSLAEPNSSRN
jgi:hypothetical protein